MKFVIVVVVAVVASLNFATCSSSSFSSTSKGCTEVQNDHFDRQGRYQMTISTTFSIDKIDPNFLIINNITVDYGSKDFTKSICVVPDVGEILCLSNTFENKSLRFPLQNDTGISLFYIVASVINSGNPNEIYNYTLFPQIFDEGYFSIDSGEIFGDIVNKRCFGGAYYDRHGKLQESLNQCCATFNQPIPEYPKNLTETTCKKFKSRTTIHNVDDNYSIFATTQVNYTLNGKTLTLHGESIGPEDLRIWVGMNTFKSCFVSQNSTFITCSLQIPDGDSKFIVNTEYENSTMPINFDDIIQEHRITIGRLLFRSGIAMMAESKPFTPQNNCQYFNHDFSPNQVVSSSFCCTGFKKKIIYY